jgi:hypothetical protein
MVLGARILDWEENVNGEGKMKGYLPGNDNYNMVGASNCAFKV